MDKYTKMSIDSRRQAIEGTYNLNEMLQKKVEKLFKEVEKMGVRCKDVGEFETKFMASPLNQEYTNLFTEVATKSQMKGTETKKNNVGKIMTEGIIGGVAENLVDQAKNTVIPTRAAINQKAHDEARKVPVLGDVVDVGQKASYVTHLGKVFGVRKKKKEK